MGDEPYVRRCLDCNAEITLCNGHVFGGDFVAFMEGKIPKEQVRERCPRCECKRGVCEKKGLAYHPENGGEYPYPHRFYEP